VAEKWSIEAEYIQSCNCDYGCPCNFNGYPTTGNCEALVAYRIRHGKFGSTSLDGTTFAWALWWPKAIHEGHGVGRVYVDPAASPEQRKAVEEITGGKHGGGIFEIFPKTFARTYPLSVKPIDFHYDGASSWFKVEGVGEVHSEPHKNPVTGVPVETYVKLPKGLAFREAPVTNIRRWWMRDEDLLAVHENVNGHVTIVKINETGVVG